MTDEELMKIISTKVIEGIIETLKEYRDAGKSLDEVITAFEQQKNG